MLLLLFVLFPARGSSEVPKIRQPLRPQATTNAKTRKSSPRVSIRNLVHGCYFLEAQGEMV